MSRGWLGSGLGKPLDDENVHRPEIFGLLSGLQLGELVTPRALASVLTHRGGGLKNIPENARRVALLNQADTPQAQAQADSLVKVLLQSYHSVIIAEGWTDPCGPRTDCRHRPQRPGAACEKAAADWRGSLCPRG
jgi:hypothetical protein